MRTPVVHHILVTAVLLRHPAAPVKLRTTGAILLLAQILTRITAILTTFLASFAGITAIGIPM
jgi:hypothetical protein